MAPNRVEPFHFKSDVAELNGLLYYDVKVLEKSVRKQRFRIWYTFEMHVLNLKDSPQQRTWGAYCNAFALLWCSEWNEGVFYLRVHSNVNGITETKMFLCDWCFHGWYMTQKECLCFPGVWSFTLSFCCLPFFLLTSPHQDQRLPKFHVRVRF